MTCTTVDGTCEMLLGRWVRAPGGEAGGTDRNRLVLGDMSGCYILFIILANLWKGVQQTSDEGYRPKSLKAVVSIGNQPDKAVTDVRTAGKDTHGTVPG